VLSAYGMGLADLRTLREATVERPLAEAAADLAAQAAALASEAEAALWAQNVPLLRVETVASLLVKYAGTDTPLRVALGDAAAVREAFEALHQRRFGFVSPGTALMIEALAVEAIGHADAGEAPDLGLGRRSQTRALGDPRPSAWPAPSTPRRCSSARPCRSAVRWPGRPSFARPPAPR
jgi:5-oxoprolinase (ATP-hydrolysing)